MTDHTNEELLDAFLAATRLAALHREPGGIEQSRQHYEKKTEEYRREIIRRIEGPA